MVKLFLLVFAKLGRRVEWSCLKWNKPSLEFYESLGARQIDDWIPLRMDGEKLEHLGNKVTE